MLSKHFWRHNLAERNRCIPLVTKWSSPESYVRRWPQLVSVCVLLLKGKCFWTTVPVLRWVYCRFEDKLVLTCWNNRSTRRASIKHYPALVLIPSFFVPGILQSGFFFLWNTCPALRHLTRMSLKQHGCNKWHQTFKSCLCFKIMCLHCKNSVAFSQPPCNEYFTYQSAYLSKVESQKFFTARCYKLCAGNPWVIWF